MMKQKNKQRMDKEDQTMTDKSKNPRMREKVLKMTNQAKKLRTKSNEP